MLWRFGGLPCPLFSVFALSRAGVQGRRLPYFGGPWLHGHLLTHVAYVWGGTVGPPCLVSSDLGLFLAVWLALVINYLV